MDPPIIQIPCTGSCNGPTSAAGPLLARSSQLRKGSRSFRSRCPKSIVRRARGRAASHPLSRSLTTQRVDRTCVYTRMTVVRMLLFLGAAFFALAEVRAAPTRYDQRQDGDFNLHAKLENFLFVVAVPSSSEHLSDLALGALEQVIFRSKDQGSIKTGEAVRQDEPYSVEILQINENRPDKESSLRKAVGVEAGTLNVSDQQPTPVGDGQTESAERIARNVKNFDFPKSREVPSVPGYFMNARKTPGPKTGNRGRARNVGNVWNPDVEPGRPGTSLKKQLPQRKEGVVALPSSNAEKNDVSPFAEEKQELRLLGDGVENCGPGRRRDASGVCQFDGSSLF